ncbi:MAG: MBL fold metallo-hydrolase [Candidatus Acidiferrum sp.]
MGRWNRVLTGMVLLAMGTCAPEGLRAQRNDAAKTSATTTKVVMLGAGTPQARPETSGPAVAIVAGGAVYLVDAGPGVVRRAAAAAEKGIAELRVQNLKTVFITHLHSDHTLGLPDVIFSPWVLGRTEPVELYGPRGLRDMAEHIEKAWEKDVDVRTNGLEQGNRTGYQVHVHEIEPGVIYQDKNVKVTAFLVKHGSWDQSFGYRFDTADRSIVLSGDTGPTDAVAKACHGCDVMLNEVYSETALLALHSAKEEKYFHAFHVSPREVGEEGTEAKPGLLVLYHEVYWGNVTREEILEEVKKWYAGKVVTGEDLGVY